MSSYSSKHWFNKNMPVKTVWNSLWHGFGRAFNFLKMLMPNYNCKTAQTMSSFQKAPIKPEERLIMNSLPIKPIFHSNWFSGWVANQGISIPRRISKISALEYHIRSSRDINSRNNRGHPLGMSTLMPHQSKNTHVLKSISCTHNIISITIPKYILIVTKTYFKTVKKT